MTDRKVLADQSETPEDVATLYSWANLHGAKYRDFSASRAQMREKARERVQQAIAEEQQKAQQDAERQAAEAAAAEAKAQADAEAERQAEVWRIADEARQVEERQLAEIAAKEASERATQQAAREAAQLAAQQRAWQQPPPAERIPSYVPPAPQPGPAPIQSYQPQAPRLPVPVFTPQPPAVPAYQAPQQAPVYPMPQPVVPSGPPQFTQPQYNQPLPGQPQFSQLQQGQPPINQPQYGQAQFGPHQHSQMQYVPQREETFNQPRTMWNVPEGRENVSLPAWLATERADAMAPPPAQPGEDSLQSSRDRLTSRWFALKGVLDGGNAGAAEAIAAPPPQAAKAPVLAVFSLAGGVGKTSLLATLGRALSARGERVLLVDTAAYGVLPFFFGARDQRPGVLRTFSPPGGAGDAPIQMVTLDPENMGPDTANQENLAQEISRLANGSSRVLVDLATASGAITRRVLRMAPIVLVPVIPDMNSVVSVSAIESFFRHNSNAAGKQVLPFYLLNQFDYSLPLHLDVREVLRQQVGERLLPFVLRRSPAVNEALAEGMTVMDYAPNSIAAEDFSTLAGWLKSVAAPATTVYRGVRWSER